MLKSKLVFLSSDNIAIPCLDSLKKDYDVLVITKTDKQQKRSSQKKANDFASYCEDNNLDIIKIDKFTDEIIDKLKNYAAEYAVCFSFGLIIPNKVLDLYPNKLLNVHPSNLPKYRGPSPIQAALLNGDTQTAISFMIMDAKMDEGDVLQQISIDIKPEDNYTTLSNNIAQIAGDNISKVLADYMSGSIKPMPQTDKAIYCKMIKKEDAEIDYSKTAQDIYNMYRAYYEWPKLYTYWNDKKIILIEIELSSLVKKNIGDIYTEDNNVLLQLKEGSLILKEIQLEGKKNMPIKAFINGYKEFINSNINSSQ
ncbi:MAG: methionyl-tRNA formyltransferase [Candidatus Komeilibacteria bacterium]